jgi:hypothetical protein
LSGLADGDERCDVARGRLPVGMWHRANHRPDNRRCLIDTIRPCRHEVADIVIDPTFAVDISAALKPSVIGIAVGVVAGERQTPAWTAERPRHLPERRLGQGEGPCAETQGIEGDGKVRGCSGSFGSSRSRQTGWSSWLPFLVWRRGYASDPVDGSGPVRDPAHMVRQVGRLIRSNIGSGHDELPNCLQDGDEVATSAK